MSGPNETVSNINEQADGLVLFRLAAIKLVTPDTGVEGITSLTAIGGLNDYSSLSPIAQAFFVEALIGQTIPLIHGTNFNPISVQAVPEPSSLAVLSGIAMLGMVRRRRVK